MAKNKKISTRLASYASKKGLKGEQANRYKYGGLTNIKKRMSGKGKKKP